MYVRAVLTDRIMQAMDSINRLGISLRVMSSAWTISKGRHSE
jgi:hypothetical protein